MLAGLYAGFLFNRQEYAIGGGCTPIDHRKNYVFRAQSVQPMRGRTRQLTSSYTLTVTRDSVIADLPYFGRAYVAPVDVTRSPLQFTSTHFKYSADTTAKGNWNIGIRFHDVREVDQVTMTITKDGYATLQVMPPNLQSITFNGIVNKR